MPVWDAIEVAPRRTVAHTGRAELSSASTPSHPTAPLPSNEDSDLIIPSDCCYFCLTRGGNAAYECRKEEGEDLCTRCIRDKKKKCRLPTPQESAAIAARCPRCTTRGFKACDGGDPCDTCRRNKTEHLCHKLPEKKKTKSESQPRRSASTPQSEHVATEKPVRGRTSRRTDYNNAQPSTQNGHEEPKRSTIPSGTARSKRRKLLPDSTPHEHTQVTSPRSSPSGSSLRESMRESVEIVEANEQIHDADDGLPSPMSPILGDGVELDTASSGDIPMDEADVDQGKENGTSNLRLGRRSIRARPRVSYVVQFSDDASDQGGVLALEDESESDVSDVYMSPTTDEESEADIGLVSSEDEDGDEASAASDAGSIDVMMDEESIRVEDDEPKPKPRRQHKTGEPTRASKGIDLSLPPLSSIQECMSDMTAKAVQLGLCEALQSLGERPIRVATMCSGTESPLLALDEISKALGKQGTIRIQHEFSAEIEVFKQGYIERNFHPPRLFRDVRDFLRESATTAVTAYGAEVDIPTEIDILIAGFVCKDLSRLNNKGKTLDDGGESGDTWEAIYTYAKRFRPSVVLLENVRNLASTWDDVVKRWSDIGYEAQWIYCDTKNYYLPQTRERMYMIAVERSQFGKGVKSATNQWKGMMRKLERQCSSPYEAFLPESLKESSGYSLLKNEPDWALCKLRNDHIRSEKRLGILSPISRRSDNGTVMPPDFADRKFYISQSSRVHDAIDIAHLEAAAKGYDSLYKMALWDVSQNVDRFKADLGIAPCITPGGQDFASNRQYALNGSQLLILQGMPLDRLLFANETQKDLQNLAGNAMSSTVIGASLISALIAGSKAFRPYKVESSAAALSASPPGNMITQPDMLERTLLQPSTYEDLDLVKLQQDATSSSRMCACEGKQAVSKTAIQICSACGHSACTLCAGNPKHIYSTVLPASHRMLSPDGFIRRWRHLLPVRLQFDIFPDISHLASKLGAKDPILNEYLAIVSEAQLGSQYFCISEFSRDYNEWKITYSSLQATVELKVGHDIQWSLFVKCPSDLPGNSALREFLSSPIVQGTAADSLLNAEWRVRIPSTKDFILNLSGSPERVSSWRSRLGLSDYKEEAVPQSIKIQSDDLTAIVGHYEHQPHCGTASTSLYKRSTQANSMYMFLDPNPIGRLEHDSFVFSHDHTRKHYGETRSSLARMHPSWRPWHMEEDGRVHGITATILDVWAPAVITLVPVCLPLKIDFLEEGRLVNNALPDCSQALTFLDVSLHDELSVQTFADYSWALENARTLPVCSSWQTVQSDWPRKCSCAPVYPKILWNVSEKGVATAHEDRQAASTFERALKRRPEIVRLEARSDASGTQIRIGVNIMSLVHRAQGRLPKATSTTTAWRLVTDHFDLSHQQLPKFRLQSNTNDIHDSLVTLPKYLRGAQKKSVAWMASQELGRATTISEIEESVHSSLGWRAEARIETEQIVRGGVLADQPSFGKTVASIGLVQSEFHQVTPEELIKRNRRLAARQPQRLDSAATLVVCPPHITHQWSTELQGFLGSEEFEGYNVLVIENCSQLKSLTIEDLLQSKIVIVSWTLFAEEAYVSELTRFTALPEPLKTSRRAFSCWLDKAVSQIPSQLAVYQCHEYRSFERLTEQLLNERLQQPEFQATLPINIRHGAAYESFSAMLSQLGHSKQAKANAKAPTKSRGNSSSHLAPLLHLFRFNRIIIDEYHYLNDASKMESNFIATSIKQVAAHKRWVLSGTPALANFSDVNQLASFLGIKLGRYFCGDGTITTSAEKTSRLDQTDVESFLSQTEVMSRQWHEGRHQRAQAFLDNFVRQNEAELRHIQCSEKLLSVDLDVAHYALYLELSQYLISQRMQIKKLNKKSGSDRSSRLNDSLESSASAEEALLRCALLFETEEGRSALEVLIEKRSHQLRSTQKELLRLLSGFEGLMKATVNAESGIQDLYGHFKKDITQYNWLGDDESSQIVRAILKRAQKTPEAGFTDLKKTSKAQRERIIKQQLSQLRDVSLELAHRTRSKRFVISIRDHLQLATAEKTQLLRCSSPCCKGTSDLQTLFSIPHCGHIACRECLDLRTDDEACVHTDCNSYASKQNLIRMADLGSSEGQDTEQGFGNKLEAIVQLVRGMPTSDQGIVFAPNEEIINILETVFDHHDISYHSPGRSRHNASAKLMEDFKTNTDPKRRKKLIVLNLGSESAAGVNLTIANHVIFVSPLLAKTQYEYESAMAQAVARSRRYGQKKKVHIYHVVAQRTIDVDILEHRHRRSDAITTLDCTTKSLASSSVKKERTRLVKNNKGEIMLVPQTWLAEETKRETLGIKESQEKLTSLINFSETFE
ncbi:hypothetical protein G6011_02734 [Alternaria panax]|uniref:Helicase ATP-binding domain-containing protein n=1 Tax=Alternaria panax TaxID=48097 RepID=A0AAD4I568_9PLEO|nr:hypothetical protein G6011_02734 [Alternaria panax]